MPRPAKKKTRVLAKAQREGELKAEIEHEYKSVKFLADVIPFLPEKYKKNAVIWMKHLIEEHIAEIPKGIATLGMTLIVKWVIHSSDTLLSRVAEITTTPMPKLRIGGIPLLTPIGMRFATETTTGLDTIPEWAEWLIAFTVAYIIVEHAGVIFGMLGEGVGGLTKIVGLLIG